MGASKVAAEAARAERADVDMAVEISRAGEPPDDEDDDLTQALALSASAALDSSAHRRRSEEEEIAAAIAESLRVSKEVDRREMLREELDEELAAFSTECAKEASFAGAALDVCVVDAQCDPVHASASLDDASSSPAKRKVGEDASVACAACDGTGRLLSDP